MKKFLKNTLCATVIALASCAPPPKKLEDCKLDQRYSLSTDQYKINMYYQEDSVSIMLTDLKGKKDTLYFNDNDFSKGNGVDSIRNMGKGILCYRTKKPKCDEKELKRANELFKSALEKLGFGKKLKPKKGILDGWQQ